MAIPLRIAMLAPPWLPVPPWAYGGIEQVVADLCEGLVRLGHEVVLFAAPGSRSSARVQEVLPATYPRAIGQALYEADHVARVFAHVEQEAAGGRPFDLLHDHCGFTALAMADRLGTPVVHTLHGAFTDHTRAFYARHADKATVVALSRSQRDSAPPGMQVVDVIPNPLDAATWPFQADKDDYLLWIGRVEPVKGPDRAISVARRAGRRLILAGPVQPGRQEFFEREVEPYVDGDLIRYVGEADRAAKQQLYARAAALLMPIRWAEPFGMVMLEALASGTPVVTLAEGAAPEIVRDGETGFVVADEDAMIAAIDKVSELSGELCRADVVERFSVEHVAGAYAEVYRSVVAGRA